MNHFIGEDIQVVRERGEFLEKSPRCPDAFIWRNEKIVVTELMESWFDFSRRGDKSRNMREEHLRRAQTRGSWGVGRFFFKIRDSQGHIFTIYYDRAPGNSEDRKGRWILFTKE